MLEKFKDEFNIAFPGVSNRYASRDRRRHLLRVEADTTGQDKTQSNGQTSQASQALTSTSPPLPADEIMPQQTNGPTTSQRTSQSSGSQPVSQAKKKVRPRPRPRPKTKVLSANEEEEHTQELTSIASPEDDNRTSSTSRKDSEPPTVDYVQNNHPSTPGEYQNHCSTLLSATDLI